MALREVPANPLLECFHVEIDDGRDVEREQLGNDQSADDGQAERAPGFGAGAQAQRNRQCAHQRGLADALHGTGVRLLIARPGFVIGRMTQGMTPAPLSSTPDQVAAGTARALAKGRRTVWIPWALGPASVAMRLLPQFVWRRMPR